jgi:hypothetical protein
MRVRRDHWRDQVPLICFVRLSVLWRERAHLATIQPRFWPRLLLILATSLAIAPLNGLQQLLYGRRIRATAVHPRPIFVLGHWRSGTTHLHNLLALDPRFAVVTNQQCITPEASLVGGRWLRRLMGLLLRQERPMDRMAWSPDLPQEEETAVAKSAPVSIHAAFQFPTQALELFERRVLQEPAGYAAALLRVLRIATLHGGGRPLVLKSPSHTAQIPLLLRLFPEARFVFLHRDPWAVYASTLHVHARVLPRTALEPYSRPCIQANVLALYRRLMGSYLRERQHIPAGQLVEIAYADLDADPLTTLERLYAALDLGPFEPQRQRVATYVDQQSGHRRNRLQLSAADRELVSAHWAFAVEAFGYGRAALAGAGHAR